MQEAKARRKGEASPAPLASPPLALHQRHEPLQGLPPPRRGRAVLPLGERGPAIPAAFSCGRRRVKQRGLGSDGANHAVTSGASGSSLHERARRKSTGRNFGQEPPVLMSIKRCIGSSNAVLATPVSSLPRYSYSGGEYAGGRARHPSFCPTRPLPSIKVKPPTYPATASSVLHTKHFGNTEKYRRTTRTRNSNERTIYGIPRSPSHRRRRPGPRAG